MKLSAFRTAAPPARIALAVAALMCAPATSRAQSAIIYGSLGNFDIANDTGKVCHGFEVDIDGVSVDQVPGAFSANRYGMPTITPTPTGVAVRWQTSYDAGAGAWATRTLQHTVPWFSGQCYQWVPATYQDGGCEHFGTWTTGNATQVSSHWLCEDAATPGALVPAQPPTAVPYATYVVAPPARVADPPQLQAEVDAPEPPEAPELFGDAQWERTFIVQLPRELTLEELVADNPGAVPMDPAQLEANYNLLQADPPNSGNTGGRGRGRHRHTSTILPTTRAVVRRIELWAYTGNYDPVTHEALCADLTCKTASAGEVGELLSVQMTAANVIPDSVVVTAVGKGLVESTDKLISCGSKCAASYNAGSAVTLKAKAASGSVFSGWNGACAGTGDCTVAANGIVNVGATFVTAPAGGGGGGATGGGGGGGSTTTQFALQVSRTNSGTVIGSPAGDKLLSCGTAAGTCSAKFAAGTLVTLTATPPAGKSFVGWGGACSGTALTCAVTMDASKSVQATFTK